VSVERVDPCEDCGSPLQSGQRYCLACGARAGSRSPGLAEMLRRVGARHEAQDVVADAAVAAAAGGRSARIAGVPAPAPGTAPPRSALRLPAPRVSVLLVLAFLGFGVLLGGVTGSPVNSTLAASGRRLQLVLPQSTAAAPTPAFPSPSAGGEPPESEPAPTPAAAEASTTAAAKAPPASSEGTSPSSTAGEGGSSSSSGSSPNGSSSRLPPVKHVFVIMLSDQPYAAVFGPSSTAPYLSQTLERRGTLLVRYDAVAHEQLANELALLSGQGPTAETAANCPTYADIAPAGAAAEEQVLGNGCVYPPATRTLAGQLTAKHLTWRAYVQGTDEGRGQPAACAHPALGQPDPTAAATPPAEAYATFRNPFVYFHSVTDAPACAADDVGLDRLKHDLASSARTPSFSYIAPNGCHDGSPTPCAPGAPAGLAPADGFIKQVVPEILGSKAYKDGGLLVITVDEAPSSGEFADSSACCGAPQFPNLAAAPGSPSGGGTVGALLLSPFIKGAATSQEPYNHFSLLRTIEDLFGLKHLGYAGLAKVAPFEASIFTRARGG
jgi:hypothetical protein